MASLLGLPLLENYTLLNYLFEGIADHGNKSHCWSNHLGPWYRCPEYGPVLWLDWLDSSYRWRLYCPDGHHGCPDPSSHWARQYVHRHRWGTKWQCEEPCFCLRATTACQTWVLFVSQGFFAQGLAPTCSWKTHCIPLASSWGSWWVVLHHCWRSFQVTALLLHSGQLTLATLLGPWNILVPTFSSCLRSDRVYTFYRKTTQEWAAGHSTLPAIHRHC